MLDPEVLLGVDGCGFVGLEMAGLALVQGVQLLLGELFGLPDDVLVRR